MPALTKEQLQDLYYVQNLNEREIAKQLGISRATVGSYRIKYGFIPKTQPVFPRCPECNTMTNFLRDEGLGFCPQCLIRINAKGQVVSEVET